LAYLTELGIDELSGRNSESQRAEIVDDSIVLGGDRRFYPSKETHRIELRRRNVGHVDGDRVQPLIRPHRRNIAIVLGNKIPVGSIEIIVDPVKTDRRIFQARVAPQMLYSYLICTERRIIGSSFKVDEMTACSARHIMDV